MTSLYELNADYARLMERLYDDELDEQTIIDTLDSIEGVIEDKADGYCKIIRQFENDVAGLKAEEERLAKRRKALENRINVLKGNLFNAMKTIGMPKIKTDLFTVSIQKNGGKRTLIVDVDPADLPKQYQKVTVDADRDALRNLLSVYESCEFCHLAPQGESLRIR